MAQQAISPEKVKSIIAISEDKDFLPAATELLEGSPHGKKGMAVTKLNTEGKVAKKQLYLSLAHGLMKLLLKFLVVYICIALEKSYWMCCCRLPVLGINRLFGEFSLEQKADRHR